MSSPFDRRLSTVSRDVSPFGALNVQSSYRVDVNVPVGAGVGPLLADDLNANSSVTSNR
jgi:hypothetical protein